MNRFLVVGGIIVLLLLFSFFFVSTEEKVVEKPVAQPESAETVTTLPILKKGDAESKVENDTLSTDEKKKRENTKSETSAPIEGRASEDEGKNLSFEEWEERSFRKREEAARIKGPEALERFYEREREIAKRKAKIEAFRKANDTYFQAKQEWMAQMAKARKEGDVAKIMELEKNRPVPPMLKKKNPEEER